MKNYIQPGDVITLLAPAAVVSGDGVLVGKFFGVAAYNAAIGAPVECSLVGVFELPKVAGAITQGQALYWDDVAKAVTSVAGALAKIGAATEAALDASAIVRVRLDGKSLA